MTSSELSSDIVFANMKKNGWRQLESIAPLDRVSELDTRFRFMLFERQQEFVLMSDGCRRKRKIEHDLDEYLIAVPVDSREFFIELANYVAFYHLTRGALYPASAYSLGSSFIEDSPFDDLLVASPYFLTETDYPIMEGPSRLYLNFCLPVFAHEREWAEKRLFYGIDGAIGEHKVSFFADTERGSFL